MNESETTPKGQATRRTRLSRYLFPLPTDGPSGGGVRVRSIVLCGRMGRRGQPVVSGHVLLGRHTAQRPSDERWVQRSGEDCRRWTGSQRRGPRRGMAPRGARCRGWMWAGRYGGCRVARQDRCGSRVRATSSSPASRCWRTARPTRLSCISRPMDRSPRRRTGLRPMPAHTRSASWSCHQADRTHWQSEALEWPRRVSSRWPCDAHANRRPPTGDVQWPSSFPPSFDTGDTCTMKAVRVP